MGKVYGAILDRWVARSGLPRTIELVWDLDRFRLDRFRDASGPLVIAPASRGDGERQDESVPLAFHPGPTLDHFVDTTTSRPASGRTCATGSPRPTRASTRKR
ncbi:MAG TPA: hypothetical protein VIL20_30430 [Sandaracinaceae bacterium]